MSENDAESAKEPAPEAHATRGGAGGEEVARLAYGLVPLAFKTLESVLRAPTRQSGQQVSAAKVILDAAQGFQQAAAPIVPIRLVDAQAASAELLRRKTSGQ